MHSYIFKKVKADEDINVQASHNWLNTGLSSHIKGYITVLQEQEIATKGTIKRYTKDSKIHSQRKLCGKQEETVLHVLGNCSALSSSLYISARHDNIAQMRMHGIAKIKQPKKQRGSFSAVSNTTTQEIWWDHRVSTVHKVKHNCPDVIIWDKEQKKCTVIDICAPIDFNVNNRHFIKIDKYMPLVSELQQLHPVYTYQIVPIMVDVLGTISKNLPKYLQNLGIKEEDQGKVTRKLQKAAILGSVKIMKTFMKM